MSALYFVDKDAFGDDCLWRGDGPDDSTSAPVVARHELGEHQDVLWPVLVAVLAEDKETVEKVARAIHEYNEYDPVQRAPWEQMQGVHRWNRLGQAHHALRALRGES